MREGRLTRLIAQLAFGLRARLIAGLMACLFVPIIVLLIVSATILFSWSWLFVILSIGLFFPVVGLVKKLVVGPIIKWLSSQQLEKPARFIPNQGIWRSGRNGLIVGPIGGLTLGLIVGLITKLAVSMLDSLQYFPGTPSDQFIFEWLHTPPSDWLIVGLVNAPIVGLAFGLPGALFIGWELGGGAFVGHFLLRFLLWRSKVIPWNYPHFLDSAAERILLSKVGGGYIFVHRLLLEYFASLDSVP